MAGVKDASTAAGITTNSKHARMKRLHKLFGIRNLKDLFPERATPNGAEFNYLNCSGDVLRDLCQIGEHLKNRRMSVHAAKLRVRRHFKAGQMATHQDVKNLLRILRANEVEAAMKNHIIQHEDQETNSKETALDERLPPAKDSDIVAVVEPVELDYSKIDPMLVGNDKPGAESDIQEASRLVPSMPPPVTKASALQLPHKPNPFPPRQVSHPPRPSGTGPPTKYDALIEKNARLSSALIFAQQQFKTIEAKIGAGEPIWAVDAMIGSQLIEQVLADNKLAGTL
jgi:hypothetical protein